MKKFEIGKVYAIESAYQRGSIAVEARTAKFLTYTYCGLTFKSAIRTDGDCEYVRVAKSKYVECKADAVTPGEPETPDKAQGPDADTTEAEAEAATETVPAEAQMTDGAAIALIGQRAEELAKLPGVKEKAREIYEREGADAMQNYVYLLAIATLCGTTPVEPADAPEAEAATNEAVTETADAPEAETPASETEAPDADDVREYMAIVRSVGENCLNRAKDERDCAWAATARREIDWYLSEAERDGVVLEVEYDANGRFADVRERKRKPEAGSAAAGQPAPQADMTDAERLDALFHELVPAEGKADTVAGEIVRAVCRIGYRYNNDGDYVGCGYGKETCNPAARYLMANAGENVAEIVRCLWAAGEECGVLDDGSYEDWLSELVKATLVYLEANPELKTTPNAVDMWEYRDPEEDVDDEWDEEDEEDEDADEWDAA